MLDIVPAQQDELALPVEVVHVDDAEARLTRPSARPGQHRAFSNKTTREEAKEAQQDEDAGEGNGVLDRRVFGQTELGQQEALSRLGRRVASTLRPSIITTGMVKGNNRD
ncbi:MAG TPA: hypothetical protein VKB16_04455, partial [Beijerinckiaceae bacterium]|nr:hypothetical protein [Beijerinckiaceae bacterium]